MIAANLISTLCRLLLTRIAVQRQFDLLAGPLFIWELALSLPPPPFPTPILPPVPV